MIPFPYNENSLSRNGVTFTVNSDGSVTIETGSGGATANATLTLMYQTTLLNDRAVHCLLSTSKTEFIAETDVNLVYSVRNPDTSQKEYTRNNNFEITQANSPHSADGEMLNLSVWVKSGKVITTPITVYPLICDLSETDITYESYYVPLKDRVGEIEEKLITVRTDATLHSEATDIGVTFDSAASAKYVFKYGKVVNFRLRFVVASAITLSAAKKVASIGYIPVCSGQRCIITAVTTPYSIVGSAANGEGDIIFPKGLTLQAGTYDVSCTFICQ